MGKRGGASVAAAVILIGVCDLLRCCRQRGLAARRRFWHMSFYHISPFQNALHERCGLAGDIVQKYAAMDGLAMVTGSAIEKAGSGQEIICRSGTISAGAAATIGLLLILINNQKSGARRD